MYAVVFRNGNYKDKYATQSTLEEVREHYRDLFPYLPNLPGIVKRAKKVSNLVNVFLLILRNYSTDVKLMVSIVDTKPIPICKNERVKRCKKAKGSKYKGNNGRRK